MDAKRSTRRYCSDRCRKKANRSPANAERRAVVIAEAVARLRAELEPKVNQIIAERNALEAELAELRSRQGGHWCPGSVNNTGTCTACHRFVRPEHRAMAES